MWRPLHRIWRSGRKVTLAALADDLARRLVSIFLDDARGRRPVFGDTGLFQDRPDWHDLLPFHEYFHGDTGRGVGRPGPGPRTSTATTPTVFPRWPQAA